MLALFNPITLLLASICAEWFAVTEAGPFTIKLPYAALFLVILYAMTSARRINSCLVFARQNVAWIIPFLIYMLLLSGALYGSPAQNTAPRQVFYFVGSIALGGTLAAAPNPKTLCRLGAGLAIVVFMGVVEIAAHRLGLSWTDAIKQFVTSGDLHFVVYTFLKTVFSSLNSNDVNLATSVKNAIAVCILVSGLVFRSASSRPTRDFVGMGHMAVVLGLMVLLDTRSVIIAGGGGILLAIGLKAINHTGSGAAILGVKALAVVAAMIMVIGFTNSGAVTGLMADRFSFEDTSAEARVEQYTVAMDRIEQHPWKGSGYYLIDGYPVHNLFLSAWMNAGILAFLTALAFYLVLVARWVSFVWMLITQPKRWDLPLAPEWVAALPLCPFFRVWLSGAGGNLFLGEWVAMGIFLGLLFANETKQRKAAAAPSPRVTSTHSPRRGTPAVFPAHRVSHSPMASKR